MLATYLYGTHACLLVYDVTSGHTFENLLGDWLPLLRKLATDATEKPVYIALVGNKVGIVIGP